MRQEVESRKLISTSRVEEPYSFEKRAKETAKQNKKAEKQLKKEERKAAASVDAEQVQPLEE